MKRIVYLSLGVLTFVIGTIGIFLPFLPTTVFYLLTAFLWVRSSETLYHRFIQSKYHQTYVQEGVLNKKMTTKAMIRMFLLLFVIFLIPGLLVPNTIMRISLAVVYLVHVISLTYYLKRKTSGKTTASELGSLND